MIFQTGDFKKERLLELAEMARLLREFSRWRNWNWSVWAAGGVGGVIALCLLFGRVLGVAYPDGPPSFWLTLCRVGILLPAVALAMFQQFLFSRFTVPPLFRCLGLLASSAFLGLLWGQGEKLTGIENTIAIQRVSYHCLEMPNINCREVVRENRRILSAFDENVKVIINARSEPNRRLFEFLPQETKEYVRGSYQAVIAAYEQKDFQVMLDFSQKILNVVDDYNDTKSYNSIARKGLAAKEDQERRKKLELRQAEIREEVVRLEGYGQLLSKRFLKNRQAQNELGDVVKQIYMRDPSNGKAAVWAAQLKMLEEGYVPNRKPSSVAESKRKIRN